MACLGLIPQEKDKTGVMIPQRVFQCSGTIAVPTFLGGNAE